MGFIVIFIEKNRRRRRFASKAGDRMIDSVLPFTVRSIVRFLQ